VLQKEEGKMSKKNLCVIGLSKQFTDNICKQLASKLDMFYANIEEIFAYDLMDVGKIEEVCGIDYLKKEKKSIIKRVCSYENTLINIDYAMLNDDETYEIVNENCLLIYLAIDELRFVCEQKNEMVSSNLTSINQEVFGDRDFVCKNMSDLVLECENLVETEIVELAINKIIDFYSK
jgi:shikimate kinase